MFAWLKGTLLIVLIMGCCGCPNSNSPKQSILSQQQQQILQLRIELSQLRDTRQVILYRASGIDGEPVDEVALFQVKEQISQIERELDQLGETRHRE